LTSELGYDRIWDCGLFKYEMVFWYHILWSPKFFVYLEKWRIWNGMIIF
jgi:hypothetical protein